MDASGPRRIIPWLMAELVAADHTPSELRELRESLRLFHEAYVEYLRNPSKATKAAAIRALPDAEVALHEAGGGYTFSDPPAMGPMRRYYQGLAQTAFLHETAFGQVDGRET